MRLRRSRNKLNYKRQVYVGAAPEPFNLLARLYTIREDFEAAEVTCVCVHSTLCCDLIMTPHLHWET